MSDHILQHLSVAYHHRFKHFFSIFDSNKKNDSKKEKRKGNDYKLKAEYHGQMNQQNNVQVNFLRITHPTVVEDLGNGLREEEDFRPVAAYN